MKKGFPEKIPHPTIKHLICRSIGIRNLPYNSGADKVAESGFGLGIPLSPVQRIILRCVSASADGTGVLSLDIRGDADYEIFRNLLGLNNLPVRLWLPSDAEIIENNGTMEVVFHSPITLLLCVAGRRSGKTTIASILMASLARRVLKDREFLKDIPVLNDSIISLLNVACDTFQARILFKMLIDNLVKLGLLTKNSFPAERVQIGRLLLESLSSSSRSSRGRTACGICFDEFAHFQRTNGPLSDQAVWTALTPSLATFGKKSLAVIATSPAGQSGVVWELFEQRGNRPGMLTIQTPTWVMNPIISREQLDNEFQRDENLARQEYGAEFLAPHGQFINPDDIEICIQANVPPAPKNTGYHIHVDLGLKHDATAIALGYMDTRDGDQWRIVIEHVDIIKAESGQVLNAGEIETRILRLAEGKKISGITFDQHQSAYLIERLKSHGYNATEFPATSKSNQQVFSFLRDLITSGRIVLPDNRLLIDELGSLECTITSWGFRVQARYGCNDDSADAVAVCAWFLGQNASSASTWSDFFSEINRKAD
ncbi:MAG: hypothetical protein NTY09_12670 [bacterium]|nr:hypothetical protein [bacterium]